MRAVYFYLTPLLIVWQEKQNTSYTSTYKQAQSLLGHWLLDYVATQQLSLTELSRLAGLSDGTLRSLIYYAKRLPSLETCVRLTKATGYPTLSPGNLLRGGIVFAILFRVHLYARVDSVDENLV